MHLSDCAVHNGPALKPGPCDCGWDIINSEGFDDLPREDQARVLARRIREPSANEIEWGKSRLKELGLGD